MKKLLFTGCLSMILLLAACGSPDENENTTNPNSSTESMESNQVEESENESSEIDLTEYNEADLHKLHDNGYEKQEKLKVTDAEIISITPSDESFGNSVGNMVVAHVDDIPVMMHDMIGYDFEIGDIHTFYGSPNMEDGMSLIEYE